MADLVVLVGGEDFEGSSTFYPFLKQVKFEKGGEGSLSSKSL